MAIINAVSASSADVATACASATSGDTVIVPAGTVTWGLSSLGVPAGVTVEGQGAATVINLAVTGATYSSAAVYLTTNSVFKRFTVNCPATGLTAFNGNSTGWRVSEILYVQSGGSSPYFMYCGDGNGLIDQCDITGDAGNAELIFVRGFSNSWNTDHSIGTSDNVVVEDCFFRGSGYVSDANSNARMVVRRCTITGQIKVDGHGRASNNPIRGVRHMEIYQNTWTVAGGYWASIELRGGGGRIFGNRQPNGTGGLRLTDYMATAMWGNGPNPTITNVTINNPTVITTNYAHRYQTGWSVNVIVPNSTPAISGWHVITVLSPTTFSIPVNVTAMGSYSGALVQRYRTPSDIFIEDQIGRGKYLTPDDWTTSQLEPLYLWDNRYTGASFWEPVYTSIPAEAITQYTSETGNPASTYTMTDLIVLDRDHFKEVSGFNGTTGVGMGTKAAMLAIVPTLVGAAYWVTDEGSWDTGVAAGTAGQLYKWTGAAWELFYVPLTYPHPLRSAPAVPSITGHPTSAVRIVGQTVEFTAAASGNPAPEFQWRKGGSIISGQTSTTLTLSNVTSADVGSYDCVITNTQGTVTTSAATLTVNNVALGSGRKSPLRARGDLAVFW